MPTQKICEACGGSFSVRPHRRHTARYCSKWCMSSRWLQLKKHLSVETELCQKMRVPNGNSYPCVYRDGRDQKAHRVAWELVNGPIPDGLWVLHECDIQACVNPRHLFLGTPRDNSDDMIGKGRKALVSGEEHHQAKLTESDVRAIRSDRRNQYVIAADYSVARPTIGKIKQRVTWRHVA